MSKLVKGFILAGVLAGFAGYLVYSGNSGSTAQAVEAESQKPVPNTFQASGPQLPSSQRPLTVKRINLTADNTLVLRTDFNALSMAKLQYKLLELDAKLGRGEPIYLVMDTPGGSIPAGNSFIDLALSLNRPVHTITVFAASMGFNTAQRLGTRYILPSGTLMAHRATVGGVGGQIPGEFLTAAANLLRLVTKMEEANAKRLRISLDQYTQLVKDEYWVDGEDAVRQGAADELASISCDDSLKGVERETVQTMFGPVNLVWSKCPAVTMPLDFEFQGLPEQEMAIRNSLADVKQFRKLLVRRTGQL